MDNFTEPDSGSSTGLKLKGGASTLSPSTKQLYVWKAKSSLWGYFFILKMRRFGKQPLGWPRDQALVWFSALECGQDLRLTSNQQNTAQVTRRTWYITEIAAIFEETLSWWLWRSKLRCGLTQKRPCNEELSTASGQQIAKKWRPQVVYKVLNAASNHVSMELDSSSGASSSEPSLSWPLDYSFAEDPVKPCETPNLIAFKNKQMWTSLVVHQLGSHLPKEGTQVQS